MAKQFDTRALCCGTILVSMLAGCAVTSPTSTLMPGRSLPHGIQAENDRASGQRAEGDRAAGQQADQQIGQQLGTDQQQNGQQMGWNQQQQMGSNQQQPCPAPQGETGASQAMGTQPCGDQQQAGAMGTGDGGGHRDKDKKHERRDDGQQQGLGANGGQTGALSDGQQQGLGTNGGQNGGQNGAQQQAQPQADQQANGGQQGSTGY